MNGFEPWPLVSKATTQPTVPLGNGSGSIGRAVASETRSLRFTSSDQQNFYTDHVLTYLGRKDENEEKEAENELSFLKKSVPLPILTVFIFLSRKVGSVKSNTEAVD